MLGNKESTIAFENSLAEKVHANLAHTPPEALARLQRKGKKTVQQMLGTDYATYDDFWYPHFHTKPAFKIPNPSTYPSTTLTSSNPSPKPSPSADPKPLPPTLSLFHHLTLVFSCRIVLCNCVVGDASRCR